MKSVIGNLQLKKKDRPTLSELHAVRHLSVPSVYTLFSLSTNVLFALSLYEYADASKLCFLLHVPSDTLILLQLVFTRFSTSFYPDPFHSHKRSALPLPTLTPHLFWADTHLSRFSSTCFLL